MSARLCIGLNKVALLRSARGGNVPDIVEVASALVAGGCPAILVHQWSDSRHVRVEDIGALARIPQIACGEVALCVGSDIRDELVAVVRATAGVHTFVVTPFEREHLTTQRGWNASDDQARLARLVRELAPATRVSVFVDPEPHAIELAAAAGVASVELNCRCYVEAFATPAAVDALSALAAAAAHARTLGLAVHAAHDLGSRHLPDLVQTVALDQVSVGHSFVAEAVLEGARRALPSFLQAAAGRTAGSRT